MPSHLSSRAPIPRFAASALLSLLFLSRLPSASAQVGTLLDKSKLPACALQCQTLLNAQQVCVPPSAQTTDQATYQSCFCQSAYLVTFKQSPIDICGGVCTAAELQQIESWYNSLCTPGGAVVTPNQNAATQPTSTTTASSATKTASSASSKNGSNSSTHGAPSWMSTHYRWIIMIIVLILAGIAFIFLGLWLKRRHATKVDLPHRDSTLAVEEAVASLRSRHPETGSMAQLPAWERASVAMSSREMVAATTPPSAVRPAAPYHSSSEGSGKGKEKMRLAEVRDAEGAGRSAAGEAGARRSSRRLGSRLGKLGSKKERW